MHGNTKTKTYMRRLFRLSLFAFLALSFFSCQNYKYRDMDLYPIKENGLYGFVDSLGNKVVVPQYRCVSNFLNHLAAAVVDTFYDYRSDSTLNKLGLGYAKEVTKERFLNMKYGYINIENEFVIEPNLIRRFRVGDDKNVNSSLLQELTTRLSFSEGLAPYQDSITYKFGYIDTLGNQRVPAQYYSYQDFSSGKAAVQIFKCNDDEPVTDACFKWGYIDSQGQRVSEFIYKDLTSCVNGRSFGTIWSMAKDQEPKPIVRQNENGELEFEEPDLDDSMPIQSLVTVLLDEHGNVIKNDLPSIYIYYDFTDDGIAVAERQNAELFGPDLKFLDRNGNYLKPHEVQNSNPYYMGALPEEHYFADVTAMCEGYAGVKASDGTWLFIDKNMNLYSPVNDTPYEAVKPFNNGLAPVCQEGKWGYVDKDFNVVIPFKYKWVSAAGKHLMRVIQVNEDSHVVIESLINRKDSIVWQRVDNKNK